MSASVRLKTRVFSWKSALDVVTSVVMIGVAAFLVWSNSSRRLDAPPELKTPDEPVSISGGASRGSTTAPVVLIAFTDFQCPFCGRFARDVLPDLQKEYIATGRVELVYRHLPLRVHEHALKAAQAAECARSQDRFWQMHDGLFGEGAKLDDNGLRSIAASMNLDAGAFEACMKDESVLARVSRDRDQAEALGLTGTPSFLVGPRLADGRVQVTRAFSGALPIAQFRTELDSAKNGAASPSIWTRLFS